MDIFRALERSMQMDDAVWERHANPLSAYTRIPVLPMLCLAVLSRDWMGWWCLVPVFVISLWAWINPRAFPPPKRKDNWATRAVFGERVFLNRAQVPIPEHHRNWALGLSIAAVPGVVVLIWGLWAFDVPLTLLGLAVILGSKLWFLDRMVWLYQDMRDKNPVYAGWSA